MIFWSRGWGWRLTTEMQETNVDPGRQGLCVVAAMDKFTQTTEVLWRKGVARPLSERAPQPLPGQAFIAFLGAFLKEGLHSSLSGSKDQTIDNSQRTLRAYSESGLLAKGP